MKEWKFSEVIWSAAFGGISSAFGYIALFGQEPKTFDFRLFNLAVTLTGFAMTLAPAVLFQRVNVKKNGIEGPKFYGTAAILSILGKLCFIGAGIAWAARHM